MTAPVQLEREYEIILARERQLAHAVAVRVVEKPPLSVWMIFIPIIFLYYMHRARKFKAGVEIFAAELFKTRKLALDLARDTVAHGATTPPDPAEHLPAENLTAAGHEIRKAEIRQIRLLIEHYRKLLCAGGKDYAELVAQAYGDAARYRGFLADLEATEEELDAAVRHAAQDAENVSDALARLQAAQHALREEEIADAFGPRA